MPKNDQSYSVGTMSNTVALEVNFWEQYRKKRRELRISRYIIWNVTSLERPDWIGLDIGWKQDEWYETWNDVPGNVLRCSERG